MNLYAFTPDTGTTELPRWRRGVPFAEQPTHELLVPTKPPLVEEPAPTFWSWLARALAVLVAADVIGLLWIAVTW